MLDQIASFPIEILVHDDASTDGTAEILRELEASHPGRIRSILQDENKFSKGIDPFATLFRHARGEYFALCEGDDYWTSRQKLSIQASILDNNANIDICTHECNNVEFMASGFAEQPSEIPEQAPSASAPRFYDVADVITNANNVRQGFAHTGSIMIRREAGLRFAAFSEGRPHLLVSDKFIKFFGTCRGGGIALPEVMGVHRINVPGSWTARIRHEARFRELIITSKMDALLDLRDSLDGNDASIVDDACRVELGRFLNNRNISFLSRSGYIATRALRYNLRGLFEAVAGWVRECVVNVIRRRR